MHIAVCDGSQRSWALDGIPTESDVPFGHALLHIPPNRVVRCPKQRHTIDLERVSDIPNFIRSRPGKHILNALNGCSRTIDRQPVDGELPPIEHQILRRLVGQIIHPSVAVVRAWHERGQHLNARAACRNPHLTTDKTSIGQGRRRQHVVSQCRRNSSAFKSQLRGRPDPRAAHRCSKTQRDLVALHNARKWDVPRCGVRAQSRKTCTKPIAARLDQVVGMILPNPICRVACAHFIGIVHLRRNDLHRRLGQIRWRIDPQKPLCRVSPKRLLMQPPILFSPVPFLVRRGIPAQFISRVKRTVLKASKHNPRLWQIQRAVLVVVHGQGLPASAKEPKAIGVQIRGLQADCSQLVVTNAMHPFLSGSKGHPSPIRKHTSVRPISADPGIPNG